MQGWVDLVDVHANADKQTTHPDIIVLSEYYVNTASMYNLTSGDNTRSLRKIVFCEFASIAMSCL